MKLKSITLKFTTAFLLFFLGAGQLVQARPLQKSFFQFDDKKKTKPLPPLHYVRSHDFDSKHISLDLHFGWEKEQTFGIEEFTFTPLKSNFKVLKLDAGYMTINSVKTKAGKTLTFKLDEKAERLIINMDRAYNVGEDVTIVIDYQTKGGSIPRTLGFGGGGGLTFVKPTKEQPQRPWQVWSQGESEYNKYWFPSYDYPNDFRTTEMKVTVKKPLMVIGNGVLKSTKDNGSTRTYHWKMDSPYTNYLSSIVVGEYTEIRGKYKDIPVSTYVYKNWEKEGRATGKNLPDMVKFFSESLGVKYPYKKYAQTIAFNFNGGMENITATTQTDNMIRDSRTLLDGDGDGLQAHELAHQWFGDYVTCRDWGEIWLNESFATYMAVLWTEESKGKDAFLLQNRGNQRGYLGAWRQGNRHPIVTKYYRNADSVFDSYAYPRGGAVLHMLRKQLGDKNFWRALGHYLKSNANQPVSTEDLRIAIEESTGQSMDEFFDQWLYRMGHPIFEVAHRYDSATKKLNVSVKQVQKRDLTSLFPQVKYFRTPVDIEIATANGIKVETVWIEPKAENTYSFDVDSKPLLVDFDNEGTLIKELKFEKPVEELIYQMKNDKDVIGRSWALAELTKIATKKETSASVKGRILNEFRAAVRQDSAWQNRRAAIASQRSALTPAQQNGNLDSAMTSTLLSAMKDKTSRVRADAISFLGLTKNPKYYQHYRSAILSDKSYTVVDRAAIAIARTKSPKAFAVLQKLAQTDSWRDRLKIAGLNGLGELGDKRALDLGFKYGRDITASSNLRVAGLRIVSGAGRDDPRTFPLVFGNFKKAFDSGNIQNIFNALNALVRLPDPRVQEAFDLLKSKYKGQSGLLGFIKRFETRFKKSLSEKK